MNNLVLVWWPGSPGCSDSAWPLTSAGRCGEPGQEPRPSNKLGVRAAHTDCQDHIWVKTVMNSVYKSIKLIIHISFMNVELRGLHCLSNKIQDKVSRYLRRLELCYWVWDQHQYTQNANCLWSALGFRSSCRSQKSACKLGSQVQRVWCSRGDHDNKGSRRRNIELNQTLINDIKLSFWGVCECVFQCPKYLNASPRHGHGQGLI